jgi:hypothetical protein
MGEQGQWDLAKKSRKATNTKRMSPIPGEYFRQHKQKKNYPADHHLASANNEGADKYAS